MPSDRAERVEHLAAEEEPLVSAALHCARLDLRNGETFVQRLEHESQRVVAASLEDRHQGRSDASRMHCVSTQHALDRTRRPLEGAIRSVEHREHHLVRDRR